MAGHQGSNHELLLFAVAIAAAASVFAAAVDYQAAVSKGELAKAGVISRLQIALFQRANGTPAAASPAFAQAPTPTAPLDSVPGKNLSQKLNRSNGVIHPKEVDPSIEKPVPKAEDPNVVPRWPGFGGPLYPASYRGHPDERQVERLVASRSPQVGRQQG
jgi:hypothetical protein